MGSISRVVSGTLTMHTEELPEVSDLLYVQLYYRVWVPIVNNVDCLRS